MIRVPFLARWPAQLPAGKTFEAPVHHVDIYATAAAAAGAELPADRIMDGVDLTPYVMGMERMNPPHEHLFFRGGAAQAVRDKRWKPMVSAPPQSSRKRSPRMEWLFDLTAQGERVDLLAEHPEMADRLRGARDAHNKAQAEPRWPWATANAQNVDRNLSQDDEPGDEFGYSSN